jgi:hypothetical protein
MATGDPDYKLNNNHRAFYARKLLMEPDLDGVFELRNSAADFWIAAKIYEHDWDHAAG